MDRPAPVGWQRRRMDSGTAEVASLARWLLLLASLVGGAAECYEVIGADFCVHALYSMNHPEVLSIP